MEIYAEETVNIALTKSDLWILQTAISCALEHLDLEESERDDLLMAADQMREKWNEMNKE